METTRSDMISIIDFVASITGNSRKWGRVRKYAKPYIDTSGERQPIPGDVRKVLLAIAGYKCQRCGSRDNLEIDHVVPHSWGGSSGMHNLQVLCRECNRQKSNRSARDYR